MPIFVDSHHGSELSLDSIRDFLRQARVAECDDFGVRALDLYCGDDGRVFYVLAAPDEAAVRRRHAEQGVVCRRVRQVLATRRTNTALTDEQRALVRRMVVAEQTWAANPFDPDAQDEWLIQVG
jgi:predicted DNA binding protein